jgi:hypothetical protein
MDGAYDSIRSYRLLKRMGIKLIIHSFIKPRRNAKMDRGLPEGPISVMMLKTLGKKEWGRMMGYGRLWATETEFSPSQRLYGEYCMAKSMEIKL